MKIKELADGLNKVAKEVITSDGYATITSVEILPHSDGTIIVVKGAYGEKDPDGETWSNQYELEYADGKSVEFVKGMFYQFLHNDL